MEVGLRNLRYNGYYLPPPLALFYANHGILSSLSSLYRFLVLCGGIRENLQKNAKLMVPSNASTTC
jgi:hypothetical protein